MATQDLTPEDIEKNWVKFTSLLGKLGDRAEPVSKMLEGLGEERVCLAPASSREKYHNCFPGGLVDHSLRVLMNAFNLCKTFGWSIPKESLILVCLLHDLGKVGGLEDGEDYYLEQTSDWHRDKLGQRYMYNEDLQYMPHAERSLFTLQSFGVRLTNEEFVAIRIHDGMFVDENKAYSMKEPALATIVHLADLVACKQEKGVL